jgi:hypothetical protein
VTTPADGDLIKTAAVNVSPVEIETALFGIDPSSRTKPLDGSSSCGNLMMFHYLQWTLSVGPELSVA